MLFVVFGAVVGSFLLTNVVAQRASRQVESLSDAIVQQTAPRIERLASLRGTTLEIELALSRYLQEPPANRASLLTVLEAAMSRLEGDVRKHLEIGPHPDGHEHWSDLHGGWVRFQQAVRRAKDVADDGRQDAARAMFVRVVEPAATRFIDASMEAIQFHAQRGQKLASEIKDSRRETVSLLNVLTALSALLGLAGALLIDHQTRSRRALVEAHSRFLEARAAELEQFAGRVAHDIRNPLSGARMAAQLMETRGDDRAKELAGRIVRSLSRAEAITSGLLEFARSGAQPDPGARTSPAEVISDLAPGMRPEAESAGIDLQIEPVPPVLVACSTGVYLSLVGNLVKNAIKYMGEGSTRRITVRVLNQGDGVRTEVVDTGLGIPPEKLSSLFEPYFRVNRDSPGGLGLGLATVKKLAEGHGGRVGVVSAPGAGSTFWFLLPRAGRPEVSSEAPASESVSLPAARPGATRPH